MTNNTGQLPTSPYGATGAYQSASTSGFAVPAHPAAGYPAAGYPAPAASDPGRTLGVVGLILSPFAGLIGLVLSLVALRRSRRAAFRNVPALIGSIVGGLATLGVLVAIVVGGLAIGSAVDACRHLGPGQHVVNGVAYTCG